MTSIAVEDAINLEVSSDKLTASLSVKGGLDPKLLNVSLLIGLMQERGVTVTADVKSRVEALLSSCAAAPDEAHVEQVAVGVNPVHGRDERLVFEPRFHPAVQSAAPNADAEPDAHADTDADADQDGAAMDYREQSSIQTVKQGDIIGKLHPATPGEDGVNVVGETFAARPGKLIGLRADESVAISEDGSIVAQCDGVFSYRDDKLRVLKLLEIPDYVDYSTGNIEFGGDVCVAKGVRDCFVVEATGSVTVRGLVEAASVKAGMDAQLERGMTGHNKGSIETGRDLKARYLDSVRGAIGRDLHVNKEVVDCQLDVKGRLLCEHGSVFGGCLSVQGSCEVESIGNESGVKTDVTLGKIEQVDALGCDAVELLRAIKVSLERSSKEHETLVANASKLTPTQAERLTELQYEVASLEAMLAKLDAGMEELRRLAGDVSTVEMTVHKRLHQGVRLRLGAFVATFSDTLKGPLRITLDERGEPTLTDLTTGGASPLKRHTRVVRSTRARAPKKIADAAPEGG